MNCVCSHFMAGKEIVKGEVRIREGKNQNPLKLQGRELRNDYLLVNIINSMNYKLVLELLTKGVIIFTHVKLNNTKKLMGFTRSSVNIIIKFRDPNSSDLEVNYAA